MLWNIENQTKETPSTEEKKSSATSEDNLDLVKILSHSSEPEESSNFGASKV